jgi:DNA-binding transcriptional ArsR family regulator
MEKFGIAQPTVSEHLRILADAGFLTERKIKQWIFFRRNETGITAFKALVSREI